MYNNVDFYFILATGGQGIGGNGNGATGNGGDGAPTT